MSERDLQRWSREVAEDPGAPPFVELARAYRRQGRHDAARETVVRGLTVHPEHIDAHALLALIHVRAGEHEQAGDEWETILRLDPGNFHASRGLGFLALQRNDLRAARRHLEAAAAARPDDPAVAQARQVLAERARSADGDRNRVRDPSRLFASMADDAAFKGALVLDDQGLVLAGRLEESGPSQDLLAGQLAAAVAEAHRSAEILELGAWEDMLLETPKATIRLTALDGGTVLVVVADPQAPPGWVVRSATHAVDLAVRFMEEDS